MKRRGWRVALTVATLGLALVASLVALNWGAVRDHVEAWQFQATRDTWTAHHRATCGNFPEPFFQELAGYLGCPVTIERDRSQRRPLTEDLKTYTRAGVLAELQANGYRIIEQRFPRRAYVVVGYPDPPDLSEGTILPPKLLPEPTTRELKVIPR